MEDYYMKIGEMAEFFHISQKALRIYEKKGIIKPAKIDGETGYRFYTADQVKQLNALLELKALGFSLDEIKEIVVGEMPSEKFIEQLNKKKRAWEESVQLAENKIDAIETITERLANSKDLGRFEKMTEDERAWMLVKMVCVENIKTQHELTEAIWL